MSRTASELLSDEENKRVNGRVRAVRQMIGNPIAVNTKPCPNDPTKIWVLYHGSYILADNDLEEAL